jgi:hypothetical protein
MTFLAPLHQAISAITVNPWLLWAGIAAIAIPILIHLLNKRRFKIVDWAAMDFLLDADKKNRRRIRLENLLLLLLRCLAVLLIGLLLARLFVPTSVTAGLVDAAQFERIVVLDNSLSMQSRLGNESAWEVARQRLVDLAGSLAQDQADNNLTLILTSAPTTRKFNLEHIDADSIDEITAELEELEPTDAGTDLAAALVEVEDYLASQPANMNRVVYLLSDLRERDWRSLEEQPEGPVQVLGRIGKLAQATFVIDTGNDEDRNLAITEIRPEGTLVEGVTSRLDVGVTNFGATAATDLRVKLSAGEALPLEAAIDRLGPGESTTVRFNVTFSAEDEAAEPAEARSIAPRRVRVELATGQQGTDDRLLADSVAYFPVRLVPGIPTLIVDGDPSSEFGRSESFYLRRALAPGGPVPSGVSATVVTESEFESLELANYQVIFLCNIFRLGDKTAESLVKLEKWVEAGGGLVIFPGDLIDEQFFADYYYRDGAGLSPLKLEAIKGDETEETWANWRVENANHEVLKIFAGQNNPFLDNVKAFRWWGSSVKASQLGKEVAVAARLTDIEDSPLLAEKSFGRGKVLTLALPADADWTNWTSDPSYLIVMQELVKYMSSARGDEGLVRVGEPIQQPVDIALYETDVSLAGPKELKANLQAASAEPGALATDSETIWLAAHKAAELQGFYELKLARRDGAGDERVLFAANVDPTEGNLKRVDRDAMEKDLAGKNVQILDAAAAQSLADVASQTELWWYLLWALVAVLCGEQVLGWFFGWGR